ncbi:hypothetical protein SO802_022029 [Lithocarpus litseifolius]|uniref:Reverse transcriptase domain-containing protein n=1 Tax=Lithocarpus litseifolius TaxID=425828 RepID=A0AAW2CGW8_9ROSI
MQKLEAHLFIFIGSVRLSTVLDFLLRSLHRTGIGTSFAFRSPASAPLVDGSSGARMSVQVGLVSSGEEPQSLGCVTSNNAMDSELVDHIQRMQLTTNENETITICPLRRNEILEEYSLSLIGNFLTTKPIKIRVANSLTQPYSEEEVRVAQFNMHPSKALGPDGMSPFFFQKYWHIVGPDVTLAVLSVLHSGRPLKKMNFTHIVLIPKKNDPQSITEFRPISLSNVVSRIISKVLANWIKSILPNVNFDAQSAFIPDRLITNNTTMAFEMLHRMRNTRKGRTGHMAVKLDISKAYDRMEWEFLQQIMMKTGLPEKWINLVMEMVQTTSYSILINGEPKGFITPT